jgi:hypothetical protein
VQFLELAADDVWSEIAVSAAAVALLADPFRQVEDERDQQHVELARQRHQRLARRRLHIGRIDHGQAAGGQALASDEVQQIEGVGGGRLVVLVVGN